MDSLKSQVLAKCGELEKECYGMKFISSDAKFRANLPMGYILDGVNFTIQVGESTPEDDPVWALAAQILGVGEKPRPSNELLWTSFESGFIEANRFFGEPKTHGECKEAFSKWLSTLPPDALEGDREMSPKEKELAAKLLDLADDEFGNHGCNDVEESFWDGWTVEERRAFCKEFEEYNGSPEDYDPNHLHIPDFALMGFLAHKLRQPQS